MTIFCSRSAAERPANRPLLPLLVFAAALTLAPVTGHSQTPEARAPLALSHVSPAVAAAHLVARTSGTQPLSLTLVLPLRNRVALDLQIRRMSDPKDPLYGKYLTPAEFAAQYAPTQADIDAVSAFAAAHGLTVSRVSSGGTLVHVTGSAATVETAFGVHLNNYIGTDGRTFFAADREPTVSAAIAGRVLSVLGLSSNQQPHAFSHRSPASRRSAVTPLLNAYNGNAGLAPADIMNIYSLTGTSFTGSGQVAGLFETGTYTASDIQTYFNYYNVSIPVNPISVDGYDTGSAPGGAAGEVTLDIDMYAALAPGLSQIRVYEATDQNNVSFTQLLVDTFDAMAAESAANRPSVISVSYGDTENNYAASDFQALDQATAKLAGQGQTVCVSSGDAGAYTDQSLGTSQKPNASFPADDPFVLCVGGTDLNDAYDANFNCIYQSESSWSDTSDKGRGSIGTGGGGGVSSYFTLPTYQNGSFSPSVNPQGSSTNRNVPDVSLYGDYDTGGYDVYFSDPTNGPGWGGFNGTSAASPLWAAFLADVNQARAAKSLAAIGLSNPAIYQAAESSSYSSLFNDVADGSNNLYYNAVAGYDNSTGWGSFIGGNLLTALSTSNKTSTAVKVASVSGTAGQSVTLSAKLATTGGTVLSGKTLTFKVDTASGNATTSSSGTASITYTIPTSDAPGGHTITVSFAGDSADNPSSGTGTLTVSAASSPYQVRYFPRVGKESRMVGGQFQGSTNNSTWTTLYTVTATPADAYTTASVSTDPASFRYLRYLAPNGSYGNVAEVEFDSHGTKLTGTGFGTAGSYNNDGFTFAKALDGSTSTYFDAPAPGNGDYVGIDRNGTSYTKLTGTNYGTPGSYNNDGLTFMNAFDGNLSTYFDAPAPGNGDTVGMDLGSGTQKVVTRLDFCPRSGYAGRMVGGVFQGSNGHGVFTTLYTVSSAPASGVLTRVVLSNTTVYRYVQYVAPNGAYGNVAEVEFDTSP